jgi:hypothetical protein
MAPCLLQLISLHICGCGTKYDCSFGITRDRINVKTTLTLPINWEPGPLYSNIDGHELVHIVNDPFLIVILKNVPLEVMSYNPRIIEELPERVRESFGANILVSIPKHFDECTKEYLRCWKLNPEDEVDIVDRLLSATGDLRVIVTKV